MKYKVTALTPLLVGDGRELSPIDYMVWKDQVNVLDQPRIFKLLSSGPRLDGYLAQLRKATKLDFASWGGFAQNFSQRRIPFESPESTAIWNAAQSESLFIPTFAASYRGAYLPGSAIKGALRTGLAFTRWSAETMDRIAGSIEGDRLPRRVAEGAETSAGVSQMKIVAAADSGPVPPAAFRVFLTRVASLDTRQPERPQLVWKVAGRGSVAAQRVSEATPLFAEMASPGTVFEGTWDERTFFENQELTRALGWRSVPELKLIIEAANRHAGAQLDVHAHYAEAAGLAGLQKAVRGLKDELASVQNAPYTCVSSMGWGGGFLSKAGFLDTGQEGYRKILRSIPAFGKALREGVPFPKTRRIVFLGGQPATLPGWVRFQFEK
jgi:CRISPR-associated protein Csm5